MRRLLLFSFLLVSLLSSAQNKSIVVLGCATAEGVGATSASETWVNRLQAYYRKNTTDGKDTIITNLAINGSSSFNAMPSSYLAASNRPAPDPLHNVTKALSLNPDIVIVNMAFNDITYNFTKNEMIANLKQIYDSVMAQSGKRCFITTTQPRNFSATATRQLLKDLRDSIVNRFGNYCINFWDTIVNTSNQVTSTYLFADGLNGHLNSTGHGRVYGKVVNRNMFNVALPNSGPTARAGNDTVIHVPASVATLNGSQSSDVGGTITTYAWTKISGPATFTITSPSAAITNVTNLVQGTYGFRLLVTDNNGATAADTILVKVNALPVSNAGSDVSITLPTNNTTLSGSGSSDVDGTISTYSWSKISGPATFTIGTPGAVSTSVTNLVQGTYGFRLQVTDNNGASSTDTITVTVNPAPPSGNKKIAILGSSTAVGTGASTYDSAWVGRLQNYFNKNTGDGVDTLFDNLAVGGTTTYNAMPSSYTPPGGRPSPAEGMNVTTAMAGNPDIVIINFPSNDVVNGYANSETLFNLKVMYDSVLVKGKKCYVATAQPRNLTTSQMAQQKLLRDSILVKFVQYAINFWDDVAAGDYTILSAYSAGDGIHLNNAGHKKLYDRVVAANIFGAAPSNQVPVANAGTDASITLPTNSTTLNGTGSFDNDGVISTYAWTKISGPATFTITTPSAASTTVTGLVQGTYGFRLLVTDNNGSTDADTVLITVNPAPNVPPTANAGTDVSITLPTNSTTLNGTGSSDSDGSITAYAWTKVSGPSTFTITTPSTATTTVTGLVQGTYGFRLQVTDNGSATAADTVFVTVNAAGNILPVANAGGDVVMTLPTNSTTLSGSASTDSDGTITGYSWTKISGPATFTITSPTSVSTTVTGLVQGTYGFRLQVTDNSGGTAADTVLVTVNAAAGGTKKIVIVGTHTAYGLGASPIADSSWANRLQNYFRQNTTDGTDTVITNIADPWNTSSYRAMPSNYQPPAGKPWPDDALNISAAIATNPDIVILSFGSSDISSGNSVAEALTNLQVMYDSVVVRAGKICYVTSAQPRNMTAANNQLAKNLRDSILARFGTKAINFWDDIANPDFTINSLYLVSDGANANVNNAGHRLLYQRVVGANIFGGGGARFASPSLTETTLNAVAEDKLVTLNWKADESGGVESYVIEKSVDANNFEVVGKVSVNKNANGAYNFNEVLENYGMYYYRVGVARKGGNLKYSPVQKVVIRRLPVSITSIMQTKGSVAAEIDATEKQLVSVVIVNNIGQIVKKYTWSLAAGINKMPVNIDLRSKGVFFVRITNSKGDQVTKSFVLE